MYRRFGLLRGIVSLLVLGLVAAVAYQAGVAAGGAYGVAPHVVGLGIGFGFFWLLPFLFILFLVFGVFRVGRGWYGRGSYGPRGMYDRGYRAVPPMFDQWHQQAHGQAPAEAPSQHTPGQTATPPPADDDPWR